MKKAINVLCAVFWRANVALTVARVTTKLKVVRQSFNNKNLESWKQAQGKNLTESQKYYQRGDKVKHIAKVLHLFIFNARKHGDDLYSEIN